MATVDRVTETEIRVRVLDGDRTLALARAPAEVYRPVSQW